MKSRRAAALNDDEVGHGYRFRFGALAIDTSSTIFEGLPEGPRAGDIVSVVGKFGASGATLHATRMRAYAPLADLEEGQLISVESFAGDYTQYVWPPEAAIALLAPTFIDESCEYDAGFDWKLNQIWRLEGIIHDGHADTKCYFGNSPFNYRDLSPVAMEVAGRIDAIDLEAQSLTVLGVTGRLIHVTRLGTSNYVPGTLDCSYTIRPLADIAVAQYAHLGGMAGREEGTMLLAHGLRPGHAL